MAMTEELANVTAIGHSSVTLTSQIRTTCGSCSQVDICASGQVAKALPKRQLTFTLPFTSQESLAKLKIGDCVVLGVPENDMISSAGQVYLLPLIGLISFSALGEWLMMLQLLSHELFALSFGITGGYLGYLLAKYRQKHSKKADKLLPKILKTLSKSPSTKLTR